MKTTLSTLIFVMEWLFKRCGSPTIRFILIICLIFQSGNFIGQPPDIQWQKCLGGTGYDGCEDIELVEDNLSGELISLIVAGWTNSIDGDVSSLNGDFDMWVFELDTDGNLIWEDTFGGSAREDANDVLVLETGEYIISGYSESSDIDVPGNNGEEDFYIVKLSNSGELIWAKNFGGSAKDIAHSATEVGDNLVIVGSSMSSDGDVTEENLGGHDVWVIMLDATGQLIWDKSFGGSGEDIAYDVKVGLDNDIYIMCTTSSDDGPSGFHIGLGGSSDTWIINLDESGNLINEYCYGGGGSEVSREIQLTEGGYLVFSAQSDSEDGDIQGQENGDGVDMWTASVDASGNLEWESTYGGDNQEVCAWIDRALDGTFVNAGQNNGTGGDVSNNYGLSDAWLVKTSPDGNLLWEKSFGGTLEDIFTAVRAAPNSSIFAGGNTRSNDFDVSGFHGGTQDIWVIRLDDVNSEISGCTDLEACNYNSEATYDDGSCTYSEEYYNSMGQCGELTQRGETFFSSNPGPSAAYLGNAVASDDSGNVIAISDTGYGMDEEGRVRVFQWSGSEWSQLGQDLLGDSFNNDFGLSLDLSSDGTVLAISDEELCGQGHVRIYCYEVDQWVQIGQPIIGGRSVSLNSSGNRVACASHLDNCAAQLDYAGFGVYDYDSSSDTWVQVGQQVYEVAMSGANYGYDVHLSTDGATVAYNAYSNPDSEIKVYHMNEGSWEQKGQMVEFASCQNIRVSEYGEHLMIAGSIGCQRYSYEENIWTPAGSLVTPSALSGFPIGIDATPSFNRFVMSSPTSGVDFDGEVLVFEWIEDDWLEITQPLLDQSSFAYGSECVAISSGGNILVVGHPYFSTQAGQASAWELNCPIFGCTNIMACNYNPESTDDDGSCTYPECFYDCEGGCINDADNDGVCDELEAPYNPDYDGDQFISIIDMLNLFPLFGNSFSTQCPNELNEEISLFNPDYDDNGAIGVPDLLMALPLVGQQFIAGSCPLCTSGCTDSEATNYNPLATHDNGSCSYTPSCSCDLEDVFNPDTEYSSVTDIDGYTYRTLVIGEQEWMAENLNAATYSNGDLIPNVVDQTEWSNLASQGIDGWCFPDNDETLSCPYGKLYSSTVVLDERNVCPAGWHVPNEEDWSVLIDFVGTEFDAGGALKSPGTMYWADPNVGGFGTGWAAVPSGIRGTEGFQFINLGAWFWSSTVDPSGQFVTTHLYHSESSFPLGLNAASAGMSIRCVKD